MTIDKLKPGMTVYDVGRTTMGNTTLRTVSVWPVQIVIVDHEKGVVEARWNYNPPRKYYRRSWSKWRAKEPVTIKGALGIRRLATRAEIAAMRSESPNERAMP